MGLTNTHRSSHPIFFIFSNGFHNMFSTEKDELFVLSMEHKGGRARVDISVMLFISCTYITYTLFRSVQYTPNIPLPVCNNS